MQKNNPYDLIIIGGGLAGLTCALALGSHCKVLLVEKETYPHHKVCGEYVSNEVLPYLNSLGIYPLMEGAKQIHNLEISTHTGKLLKNSLPLGGFGISRYTLDAALFYKVQEHSEVIHDTIAEISFNEDLFTLHSKAGHQFTSSYVVGAFGKRSNLDKMLNRNFINKKSPWLAVKAHYSYNFDESKVALHNFDGGYCGLSKVETDAVNACYLTTYQSFKQAAGIDDFQKNIMAKNRYLAHFFEKATPLFDEPLTISQISFEEKQPVHRHIFMIGDTAGLIHPLCGNGMAMAIHSAKLFAELFIAHLHKNTSRQGLEEAYTQAWHTHFSKRLQTGRRIQNVLLSPSLSKAAFVAARAFPGVVRSIIQKTHGEVIV